MTGYTYQKLVALDLAGVTPSGNKSGQKGDDGHWETTSVPLAMVF